MPTVKRAKKTTQPKPKSKAKKGVPKGPSRKVLYPVPEVKLLRGKESLTAEQAKELMGWVGETEKVKFGADYLIKDEDDRKVRCSRNVKNRPIYTSTYLTLKQEILRGNWRLNMESRIIGRTGQVLNGQHTLIALILAAQEWAKNPDDYPQWKQEPTIETSIAFGAPEDDETVNTMDTCKPRSLADVIYRSPYFGDLNTGQRKVAARMTDYAIRLLWLRTGAGMDAFAPRRTHSEALNFLTRHPKLLEAVNHIREEDEEGNISRFVAGGYTAGFLYLMGSSTSDPMRYREGDPPQEELLDWSNWEKACEFFVLLAAGGEEVKPMRLALGRMLNSDEGVTQREKWALLVKGWVAYAGGKKITSKLLTLKYVTEDDIRTLAEMPTAGGIDLGEPKTADEAMIPVDDPTEEEIEERGEAEKGSALVRGTKKGKTWDKEDTAWVKDPDSVEAPYFAQLVDEPYDTVEGKAVTIREGEKEWEVSLAHLHVDCPATE